jgi:hypothetical protein
MLFEDRGASVIIVEMCIMGWPVERKSLLVKWTEFTDSGYSNMPHADCIDMNGSGIFHCVNSLVNHTLTQVKVKVNFALQQAMKVQRGSSGICLIVL